MEKTELIWMNICGDMASIDLDLLNLMGNLHELWERSSYPEQKVLAAAALDKLANQVVPLLDGLLNDFEESRRSQDV